MSLLMGAGQRKDAAGLSLPSVEEGSDGLLAGVLELLLMFGVEEIAVGVDDSERRNAMGDGNMILLCHVDIVVYVPGIDMHNKEVFCEKLCIGALSIVIIENLTVAAPVCAEVEDDALVLAAGGDHCGGDVGACAGGL